MSEAPKQEITEADRDYIATRKEAMRRQARYITAIMRLCEEIDNDEQNK